MNPRGSTPIELLIVVTIIAILALIAVPKFLEAQMRSKAARVRRFWEGARANEFEIHPCIFKESWQ